MRIEKAKKSQSLRRKLLLPIITVFLLQAILYAGVFVNVLILPEAETNAFDILSGQVERRAQYLENEMVTRWSNLDHAEQLLLAQLDKVLSIQHASIDQIATDPALNNAIIDAVSPEIISLLRKNTVTGAFFVLNGPTLTEQANAALHPGIYVRDLDPHTTSQTNADILMERGLPYQATALGLPLDSFWSAYFELSYQSDDLENIPIEQQYFYKPLLTAQNSDNTISKNFGYWSPMFKLTDEDISVITYSIPLIYHDGTVFGILGIDITESYLQNVLKYTDIGNEVYGAYVLATTETDSNSFSVVSINGQAYQTRFANTDTLSGIPVDDKPLYRFQVNGYDYFGSDASLRLYGSNTPFVSEQWTLIGLQLTSDLMIFSDRIKRSAYIAAILMLLLGVAAALIANQLTLRPIQDLANSIKNVNPESAVELHKTYIKEIDALTDSIEQMSEAVAESASRISKIIDLANVPLGVFESQYDGRVLCSAGVFRILDWDIKQYPDFYVPTKEFNNRLESLNEYLYDEADHLYCIPRGNFRQWLRIIVPDNNSHLPGTIIDITKETEEKMKIERERDFDSLTNIFNRRAFASKVEFMMASPNKIKIGAVMMYDLDNLKYINDTYGHEYGDHCIIALAEALRTIDDSCSITARRAGDEFISFFYGFDHPNQIRNLVQDLWRKIQSASITLPNGRPYSLQVSGGIAWYPESSIELSELIRFADFAMYGMKHHNKGNFAEFNQQEYANSAFLVNGQEALNRLLENLEFDFALQPVISVEDENVYGYEFLLRPTMPEFHSPLDVIRMAISQSKLLHLERAIWFKALRLLFELRESEKLQPDQYALINSIGSVMMSENDLDYIISIYKNILPQVILELTESEKATDEISKKKKNFIKSMLGQLAIDDYGTGYNSQYTLLTMQADIIKIDISIIQNIDTNKSKQMLLKDIITYAKTQNTRTLAEGVETRSEMETLIKMGIDYLQGFYLARPDINITPIDDQIYEQIRQVKNSLH